MDPQEYLAEIKAKLVVSSVVASMAVVEERALPDRGYFRARLMLSISHTIFTWVRNHESSRAGP